MSKYKKGLILEGGAMRGMFTCGVLDVFMENGINFDGAAGISAGATFGCNFKSRQIGRAIRYNKKYSKDWRYCSFRSLIMTGDLYGAEFCYHTMPEKLDPFDTETFKNDPLEFYIGATDVETGEARFHKCTDGGPADIEWMRASASMPVVSNIVEVDGYKMLDGGIVCSVPYEFMEQQGFDRNVIVLTRPKGYLKKKSPVVPIVRLVLRKYPAMVKAMAGRHIMYNRQMDEIDRKEARGEALVIRPPEDPGIGRTEKDPDELERVYQMGRSEALRRLPEVREFLRVSQTSQAGISHSGPLPGATTKS
ncbi:MAG: patatin family protein [Clostridiales bacterium]|nr:patatin family protein [Clostridiales bacterium]